MVILLFLVALVFISTILVIAAGMLSSRLSKQEGWSESYDGAEADSAAGAPESIN